MTSYNFLPTVQNTSSTSTSAPSWAPQVGALTQAFGGAQNAYAQQLGMGNYNGDYIAGGTQPQYDAINQATNFAQGGAANVGNNQINTGQGLLSNYNTGTNAANGLYNFGSTNQTQNNINTANQYASNPYINQQVQAAAAQGAQSISENDIPNLYRSAASSGNLNSDRAALAQGVIDRGLAQQTSANAANLYGNAWNQGLGAAQTQNQQQLGALSNAGQLGSSLGGAGSSMMSQGINDQQNLSNLYSGAGSSLQNLNQAGLSNALAKYQGNIQNMWSPVQNLYGIAGANNWGSTTSSNGTSMGISPVANQPTTPGALSYLGAGLGVAGSIAGTAVGGPAGGTIGGMAAGALGNYFGSQFGSPSTGFTGVQGGAGGMYVPTAPR